MVQNPLSLQYMTMIQELFKGNEFKSADIQKRKDLIGNAIYETVERISGSDKAPKITGMLIDLQELELNQAIMSYESLEQKVRVALNMLSIAEQQQNGSLSS